MADYTSKLNLYKADPAVDGNNTFNIKTMMNNNWDKLDEKVGNNYSKLQGIEDNANNYKHPDTHSAEIIKISDNNGEFTSNNVEGILQEVGVEIKDMKQKVNVSHLYNGLGVDSKGRITLWENPNVSYSKETFTSTQSMVYNQTFKMNISNNYGNFYRAFFFFIQSNSNKNYWIKGEISNNRGFTWYAPDANGYIRAGAEEANGHISLNNVYDGGIGAFTGDVNDDLYWGIKYNKDEGYNGQIAITLAGTGNYPHNINFDLIVFGLV